MVAAVGLATATWAAPTASAAVPNPTVTEPITATCSPSCPSPPGPVSGLHQPAAADGVSNVKYFTTAGYVEEEFFFSGTASAYQPDPTAPAWTSSGNWSAIPSTTIAPAAYESRMLVRRPADPKSFNGIVVVEWFNVSGSEDVSPDYGYYRKELLRKGFIWVGVSAQAVGVNSGGFVTSPSFPVNFGMKAYDPVRYGPLVHPGDNYAYDIFSQAAQAIRHPSGVNPFGSSHYAIKAMIADGQSQSSGYMVTYYNAIQPRVKLFDGFLIHSRGAGGAALSGVAVPSPAMLRTDQVPALVFETETDTVGHFSARQPNSGTYRLWEPAGTAHVDSADLASFFVNLPTQKPSFPAFICKDPINTAHEDYIMNSALAHLSEWITHGRAPPVAPPIDVVSGVIQRDSLGIATGGIRLPEMDVPTLTQQGVGNTASGAAPPYYTSQNAFCFLFGRALPLPVSLESLYPDHETYVSEFIHATNARAAEGFLLRPDAEEAVTNACDYSGPHPSECEWHDHH